MKVIPSALVAELKGSTAELTAASWKGRNYVRRKVTPTYRNTTAQQAVRASMAKCPALWRSLDTIIKAWQDSQAVKAGLSGFNWFTKNNRAAIEAATEITILPPVSSVPAPSNAAAVAGNASIEITWQDDEIDDYTNVIAIAYDATDNTFVGFSASVLASAETLTISGLTNSREYQVFLAYYNPTTGAIGSEFTDNATPTT